MMSEEGKPFTAAKAKEFLGWEEESETKFESDFLFKKDDGKKVRCASNLKNRFLYPANYRCIMQEILRRRYKFNGETIIIGRCGSVLNGQHQMIALILAVEEWLKNPDQWKEYWKTEPTIDKLIVLGVDEDDDTINTMDTAKPRSLMDVIGRSEFFSHLMKKERQQAARMTDYATRMLWQRTGASLVPHAPRKTHSEALAFIRNHPKILPCVEHIREEDGKDGKITKFMTPGYSSALFYLMGSANTEREKEEGVGYGQVESPSEDMLNWDLYNTARDFWTHIAKGDAKVRPIRLAIAQTGESGMNGTLSERLGIIIKAWNLYAAGEEFTPADLALEYITDGDGIRQLVETPVVGGIDIGNTN